jgi:HEPN domain-containing protein
VNNSLPTAAELKSSYLLFANFVFDLLGDIEDKKENLMLAAVNSQIALELFLKYLFTAKGKAKEIQKQKSGRIIEDFKDFHEILNYFYSSKSWSFGNKKEFIKLMQARNSIVHRGKGGQWDPELAKIIVKTNFFIHVTAWEELGELLMQENYIPHEISEVDVWRSGVESFCSELSETWDVYPIICSRCNSRSVISSELFVLEENQDVDCIVCLCCLCSINIEQEARLMECYICFEKTYLVDAWNQQAKQLHPAKCTECDTKSSVRQCANCEGFYHPAVNDYEKDGRYYCSSTCQGWSD